MEIPLWQPDRGRIDRSNLMRFMQEFAARSHRTLETFDALHQASVEDPAAFWDAVWDYCGVIGSKGDKPYLSDQGRMPGAHFFPRAALNYAENLLRRHDDGMAIVFRGEDRVRTSLTWADLNRNAAAFQRIYRDAGVTVGDRVAAILPNMPEAVAALLGASAGGAVWSSCSPDFGVKGVLDRFGQIEPTVLVACDGYFYNGKLIPLGERLQEIAASLPSLKRIVIVPYAGGAEEIAANMPNAMVWRAPDATSRESRPDFVRLSFDHPLYIVYSSGTTGVPKCIVHSHGGMLLKHLSEHQLHCDLKPGERLFYFTTLGWMMWNWLVSGLASGATLLLYDGSPFHPSGNALFDYADEERMTVFGTSAKFIDAARKAGLRPRDTHRLGSIRLICSTGSPLVAEGFDYVYDAIKPDVHLASVSGGTDICGCFVLGVPTLPVWRGEIQGPALGLAVDVLDDDGKPVRQEKGELVCKNPFPSMPVMFWNDADGSKYRAAYFSRYPGLWHHGDFAEWTSHGGLIIHGRSDATLNPGGVRIGTAEIYRQVELLSEVQESIVIGQDWDNDVRVVLFVVLKPGLTLDNALRERIKRQIREGTTPRHVPARIIQVSDIPRTKSGKITELAVRNIVHGQEVKNVEALANPAALDLYRGLEELQS